TDAPTSDFIRYNPVVTDLASPLGSSIAQNWIDVCASSHAECPSPVPLPLPTRVIEIVDEHNLRLSSSGGGGGGFNSAVGRYVALSYCWGGPQEFATTKERLQTLEDGFKASQLPQTLQDAVTVTRSLGVRYLWVDSLCIIQDSEEDKSSELPMMASYYKNAYVTVCA
ncbi:heterokaryon incompatibility protein-domain-containing protein, partial [Truncatella angustata]